MNGTSPDDEAAKAKEALARSQRHYIRGLHLWEDVFSTVSSLLGSEGSYLDQYKRVYDPKDQGEEKRGRDSDKGGNPPNDSV